MGARLSIFTVNILPKESSCRYDVRFAKGGFLETVFRIYFWQNPAVRFDSIEFATDVKLINVDKDHGNVNIVIDNICFKYTGAHAVGAAGDNVSPVTKFTVQNCEFYWIGGSIQYRFGNGTSYDRRYGNAIEIYGACDGFTAINNYIYQLYSPIKANDFFNHPILNVVLYNNLGKKDKDLLTKDMVMKFIKNEEIETVCTLKMNIYFVIRGVIILLLRWKLT